MNVRTPAVAGLFYPSAPAMLQREVENLLAAAHSESSAQRSLHALIVPHAGYVYSGPVAATAYAQLRNCSYGRVVMLGPAHRVPLRGIALPTVNEFLTPLGGVPLDTRCMGQLA